MMKLDKTIWRNAIIQSHHQQQGRQGIWQDWDSEIAKLIQPVLPMMGVYDEIATKV